MSSVSGKQETSRLALQPAAIDSEVAVLGEEIASGVTSRPTCGGRAPARRGRQPRGQIGYTLVRRMAAGSREVTVG